MTLQEGKSGVVKMDTHPPDAIAAMKEFFYKGFYTVPVVRSMVQDALAVAKQKPEQPSASKADGSAVLRTLDGGHGAIKSDVANPKTQTTTSTESQSQVGPAHHGRDDLTLVASTWSGSNETSELALTDHSCTMLFHLDVYQLAGFVGCKSLKTLAETKFEAAAEQDWQDEGFVSAVEKIYDITLASESGRRLREMTVKITTDNLKTLCENTAQFVDMMASTPSFGADVAMAMVGIFPGVCHSSEMKNFFCRSCCFSGQIPRTLSFVDSKCPACHVNGKIIVGDNTVQRRKPLACPKRTCIFTLNTEVWGDLDELRCPICTTTATASEWEYGSKWT